MSELPEYVRINREAWTRTNARYTAGRAREKWAETEITWGVWQTPESEVRMLPDVRGRDVVELGCGTAYFGAWLKRRGAHRVLGIDVTPAQLETARELNDEQGLGLELLEANAEAIPIGDAQFDLALSEYGASIWCDPELWIPEAARLLRAGGELVFMRATTLATLCMPETGKVTESLQRPQRGLNRIEWAGDEPDVEFQPGTGEMLRILRRSGFALLALVELFAPADAVDHPHYDYVPAEWARRWPAEEIWRLRKETAAPTGL